MWEKLIGQKCTDSKKCKVTTNEYPYVLVFGIVCCKMLDYVEASLECGDRSRNELVFDYAARP